MSTITINGVEIDESDPCSIVSALEASRVRAATGDNVVRISIRSPVSTDETEYAKHDLKALDALIAQYRDRCVAKLTGRRPFRRMRFRF